MFPSRRLGLLLALLACAPAMQGCAPAAPGWVLRGTSARKEARRTLVGVGAAVGAAGATRNQRLRRALAEQHARDALARLLDGFEADVRRRLGAGEELSGRGRDDTVVDVSAVPIAAAWSAPDGTEYAQAALDLEKWKEAVSRLEGGEAAALVADEVFDAEAARR